MILLRRLLELAPSRDDPKAALAEAALLVRRARLDPLSEVELTIEEVNALADAGEALAAERVVLHFREAREPGSVEAVLDGGKAFRLAALRCGVETERRAEHGA